MVRIYGAALLAMAIAIAAGCGDDGKNVAPPGQSSGGATATFGSASGTSGGGTGGSTSSGTGTGSSGGTTTGGGCDPYADPVPQCGAGFECALGDESCHPAMGEGMPGDGCSVVDEMLWLDTCSPELLCVFGDVGSGQCAVICDRANPMCTAGTSCIELDPPAAASVCLAPCALVPQDCLAPSDGCYPASDVGGNDTTACLPAGPGLDGTPCTIATDCAVGLTCTDASQHTSGCGGMGSCCTLLCDTGAPQCTGLEPTCVPLNNAASPSAGFCGIG